MCRTEADKRPAPTPPPHPGTQDPLQLLPGAHPSEFLRWLLQLLLGSALSSSARVTWPGVIGVWCWVGPCGLWAPHPTLFINSFRSAERSLTVRHLQSTYTSLPFYTNSSTLCSRCCPLLFCLTVSFGQYFMAAHRELSHSFYGCRVLRCIDLPFVELALCWWIVRLLANSATEWISLYNMPFSTIPGVSVRLSS